MGKLITNNFKYLKLNPFQRCTNHIHILQLCKHKNFYRNYCKFSSNIKFNFQSFKEAEIKYRKSDDCTNKIYLYALGSKTAGPLRSLFVYTDNGRFLFNCGDGLIRLCTEYESLHTLKNQLCGIFITSNKWHNVSGIYDLYLKINEIEDSDTRLNIYGSKGLKNCTEYYFKDFLDKKLALINKPAKFNELHEQEDTVTFNSLSVRRISIFSSNETFSGNDNILNNCVVAYACHAKENLKHFLSIEKLVEFDVPPGPLVHELGSGRSINLSNGSVVRPVDVMKINGDKGRNFIVLDIPSKDYLDSLISCKSFDDYKTLNSQDSPLVIIHFSPASVIQDEKYFSWCKSFSSSVLHMVINDTSGGIDLQKVSIYHRVLNYVQPSIFPLNSNIKDQNLQPLDFDVEKSSIIQAHCGLKLNIRPEVYCDSSNCVTRIPDDLAELIAEYNLVELKNKLNLTPNLEKTLNRPNKKFPHISFLGTGSSISMCYRNESAILVNINEDTCVLLDCGPGTLNQLYRQFGEQTKEVLGKLKMIYISHHHKDHYLGMNSIITERKHLLKQDGKDIPVLYVLGTRRVLNFVKVLNHFDPVMDYTKLIDNRNFYYQKPQYNMQILELLSYLGLEKIETTLVPHCNLAYGIALSHPDGWKLVYSGDSMPSKHLIQMGKDCDVLIHEATFQESMVKVASTKHHSTVAQAIQVGKKMRAKNVILTHFSQRYVKIPVIEDDLPPNVCVAFDHMKLSIEDIPYAGHLYSIFKSIWFEQYEQMFYNNQMREERQKKTLFK